MTRLADEATVRGVSIGSLLRRSSAVPDIPRGAPERLSALADLLDQFRAGFRPGRILEPARRMFEELDLRDHLRRGAVGAEAGARRAEAVDSVLRSIEWHERANPSSTLSSYLHGLALDSRVEEPDEADGVTLMTLHAAKGLEFPEVFLIGMEEDLLPVAGIQGEPRDLEEERRLAYVGITRARETLWLTRAAGRIRRGKLEPRTPSRFLEDLPPEAHVRHDLGADSASATTVARSTEVLRALRARLPGPTR
jgi:DNA helicase-2/ATP-dependent DNA helicase PcrA